MNYTILHGDAETMLGTLPDKSVHCIVTSPPYYGLRDYGIDGQIGLEDTPEAYVARLVAVFRAAWRALRDDGVLWLNLGDSYAGSGGAGGDYSANGLRAGQPKYNGTARQMASDSLKPKDLIGIPWRVAFALQADGWYLRSDCIWHKTAPMPESVTDRPTKAHEYVFLLTKNARYFYDAQAVSEPSVDPEGSAKRYEYAFSGAPDVKITPNDEKGHRTAPKGMREFSATRNRRSVWTLGPFSYNGAHFATMLPKLAELCILAGTSAKGCCPHCGAPWERVVERGEIERHPKAMNKQPVRMQATAHGQGTNGLGASSLAMTRDVSTIGFQPTCDCAAADPIPCTVVDPFCGSGTTLAVAIANGRNRIGIKLNAEYIELAHKRITGTQPALFGA